VSESAVSAKRLLLHVWHETGAVRNARPSRGPSGVHAEEGIVEQMLRSIHALWPRFFCRLLILSANKLWTIYPRSGIM